MTVQESQAVQPTQGQAVWHDIKSNWHKIFAFTVLVLFVFYQYQTNKGKDELERSKAQQSNLPPNHWIVPPDRVPNPSSLYRVAHEELWGKEPGDGTFQRDFENAGRDWSGYPKK